MKFLSKSSRLGLIFVGTQTVLVSLIPLWAKLYHFPCDVICIFSDNLSYFLLFNFPGWILSITPVTYILDIMRPLSVKLKGDFFITDYLFLFLSSSIIYYFIGFLIEKLWHRWRHPK